MSQWAPMTINGIKAVAHVDSAVWAPARPHHTIDQVVFADFPPDLSAGQKQVIAMFEAMVGKTYHDWLQLK